MMCHICIISLFDTPHRHNMNPILLYGGEESNKAMAEKSQNRAISVTVVTAKTSW